MRKTAAKPRRSSHARIPRTARHSQATKKPMEPQLAAGVVPSLSLKVNDLLADGAPPRHPPGGFFPGSPLGGFLQPRSHGDASGSW